MLRSLITLVIIALLAGQAAAARSSRSLLQVSGATEPDAFAAAAAAMPPVANNDFIVAFQPHVSSTPDVRLALGRLALALGAQDAPSAAASDDLAAAASTNPSAPKASPEPFELVSILSPDDDAPDAAVPAVQANVEGASTRPGTLGKLVLLRLKTPADAALLKASPDVAFVVRDVTITAADTIAAAPKASRASVGSNTTPAPSCAPVTGATATATAVKLLQPVACGKGSTDTLTYQGRTCGADLQSVRWTSATGPDGCTIKRRSGSAASAVKFNKDIFGDCGLAPAALAAPDSLGMRACPPVPADLPGPVCPRWAPPAGASLPAGVVQIEAVRAGRVAKPVGFGMAKVVVAVMASGIDQRPNDYAYAGGRTFGVEDSTKHPRDSDPAIDYYGIGTHLAGTVAANGWGSIVGVAPGVPVFSLKVLSGDGSGKFSSMLAAVEWAAGAEAAAAGVKVVVVPLTTYFAADSPIADKAKSVICNVFAKLDAAGVLVTASAGNFRTSMEYFLPAGCPTVLAATDADNAFYSSWMPVARMTQDDAFKVVSAPGGNINSTVPVSVEPSGYKVLFGTSSSAAHVAGVAANCIASQACSVTTTPAAWRALIVSAAMERATSYSPRFGSPSNPSSGDKYFGYALWSKW